MTQPPMASLLELIEQTYSLRMLLTGPIPPGKSLLSMLTNAKDDEKESAILHIAHRAFWDEVRTTSLVVGP